MDQGWVSKYIGIPYDFGHMDCWGLVRLVLQNEFNKDLPSFDHDSPDQFKLADFVSECLPLAPVVKIPFDERQPGDILLLRLWGVACHTAVIVDNNLMLHSLHKHDSGIECYTGSKWSKRVEGVYRAK